MHWTTELQVMNIHESFVTTIINERSWLKGGIYIYIYEMIIYIRKILIEDPRRKYRIQIS